jgi:hypothetical protein
VKRDELPLVTLDGRHAGELLAHPCACGYHRCTLGEHLWRSTQEMAPGPRAQNFEPAMATGRGMEVDADVLVDLTAGLHDEYRALLRTYWTVARDIARFVDRHRPDRWIPLPEPASDAEWCRNHLETIGACEPRYRGDECRVCYDLRLAYGHVPDGELMRLRHRKGYLTKPDLTAWVERLPKARKKRKKAS